MLPGIGERKEGAGVRPGLPVGTGVGGCRQRAGGCGGCSRGGMSALEEVLPSLSSGLESWVVQQSVRMAENLVKGFSIFDVLT